MTQPPVWKSGIGFTQALRSSPSSTRSRMNRALFTMPWWCSRAPLGKPVVPEVYWICTGSVGATSGSAAARSPPVEEGVEVVEGHHLAQARGAPPASARATSPMGASRNDAGANTPAARDCSRT